MEHELDLLDHLNDTVTRITEDTLLLSLLLDYMDGLSWPPGAGFPGNLRKPPPAAGGQPGAGRGRPPPPVAVLRGLRPQQGVHAVVPQPAVFPYAARMTPSRAKPAFSSTRREPGVVGEGLRVDTHDVPRLKARPAHLLHRLGHEAPAPEGRPSQ